MNQGISKLLTREISKKDIKEIVMIHLESLNDGLLVNFGSNYLFKMYAMLLENAAIKICVTDSDNNIIGFVLSGSQISLSKALGHKDYLIFIKNLFLDFRIIRMIFYRFIGRFFDNSLFNNVQDINNSKIELSHIAVLSSQRSRGIGKKLIEAFEEAASHLSIYTIYTRTHNQDLMNYYIKNKNAKIFAKSINDKDSFSYTVSWLSN